MKTKIAVLFGGHSVEHEVSIISGLQAFAALDREKYDPIPLYIGKDNAFYTGEALGNIDSYKDMKACLAAATRVLLVPGEAGVELIRYPMKKFGNNVVGSFEVALPVVHGTNVEDGTLMGYLEMLGVPYAASDLTSSALGMDKFAMKAVLRQAGLPVLDALEFTGKAYALDPDAILSQIEEKVGYPVIVKPVNPGILRGHFQGKGQGFPPGRHGPGRLLFPPDPGGTGGGTSAGNQLRRPGRLRKRPPLRLRGAGRRR